MFVQTDRVAQDGIMHMRARARTDRAATRWARLVGVVSGLAGLGLATVATVAAGLVAPLGSPVVAVGELIITILPAPLVNFGKDTLGLADKPILLAIIVIAVLLLCGLAGQLERSKRLAGAIVFAVIGLIGLVGVAAQPGSSLNAYIPVVVGGLIAYMILNTLIGKLHRWRPRRAAEGERPDSPTRRNFLGWTAAMGAVGVVAAIGGQALAQAATAVSSAREKIRLPGPTTPPISVPTGADLKIPGLSPYLTDNDDFYRIDTALQVPVIKPEDWSLKISGMVENEITINYAELTAKPLVEHVATLTCVSNEVGGNLIGNASWLGFPIRELLAEAKPKPGADMVLSTSDDGWTAGTPLSALTDPDREAILAVGMNGEPLPIAHGFPVRMVVPGLYGYVSATKWVTELKLTTFEADQGYWTPLGWSAKGPIKLSSRIDVPGTGTMDAGTVAVAGVAWAQHTGVKAVEVRIDNGEWQPAQLAETSGPDTWRQWVYQWPATPGTHRIQVRATDTDGKVQISEQAPPAPDGSTGYHSIQIKVR